MTRTRICDEGYDEMQPGIAGVPMPNEVYVDEDKTDRIPFGFQRPGAAAPKPRKTTRTMTRLPSRQAQALGRRRQR
jgi:hypothetical protein